MTIQVGDDGTLLVFTFKDHNGNVRNVSTATAQKLYLVSPLGQISMHTTTFVTDGADGQVQFVGDKSTWFIDGDWEAQAWVDTPAWAGYSAPIRITVGRNIHPTLV